MQFISQEFSQAIIYTSKRVIFGKKYGKLFRYTYICTESFLSDFSCQYRCKYRGTWDVQGSYRSTTCEGLRYHMLSNLYFQTGVVRLRRLVYKAKDYDSILSTLQSFHSPLVCVSLFYFTHNKLHNVNFKIRNILFSSFSKYIIL